MAGYVYVIENENHKVKIGMTVNPEKRISVLETQGGYKIISKYISPSIKRCSRLENELHKHFAESRSVGEWFDVDFNAVVSYVKSLDLSVYVFEEPDDDNNGGSGKNWIAYDYVEMTHKIWDMEDGIRELYHVWVDDIDTLLNRIEVLEDKIAVYEDTGEVIPYPKKKIEEESQRRMKEMFESHEKLFG